MKENEVNLKDLFMDTMVDEMLNIDGQVRANIDFGKQVARTIYDLKDEITKIFEELQKQGYIDKDIDKSDFIIYKQGFTNTFTPPDLIINFPTTNLTQINNTTHAEKLVDHIYIVGVEIKYRNGFVRSYYIDSYKVMDRFNKVSYFESVSQLVEFLAKEVARNYKDTRIDRNICYSI